ncbi:MAG: hypothetical protein RIC04_05680 [Parvibaculum sp.]|uniref:HVO_A0114 family putative DNA-binding protein n=1 Tax=Parvibaculum sp. TaxID=2024848 RepID=UPI0032EAF878
MTRNRPGGARRVLSPARRIGRDVKAVHADITALINAGMIDRTEEGVSFPYDRIRLDVDIGVAA